MTGSSGRSQVEDRGVRTPAQPHGSKALILASPAIHLLMAALSLIAQCLWWRPHRVGLISRGGEQNPTSSSNLSFLLPVYLDIIHLTWNHQQTILSLQDEKSELAVKCQSQLLSSSQGTQKASADCSAKQENQLVGIYLIQRPRTCFSKKHFDNLPTAFASQPADKTHHISGCLHPTPNAETFQKVLKRVYRQQI